jgi:signal transduction histidine kinase
LPGTLAAQNDSLRQRVQCASSRAAELNEQFFRRISVDLHDGPAQLLGFASLRQDKKGGFNGTDCNQDR